MTNLTNPPVPAFYQMADYVPLTNRSIRRRVNAENLHIGERSRVAYSILMQYFDEVTFERTGVLPGEYALFNGSILIRRDGMCIKANIAWEEKWASRFADDFCNSEVFLTEKAQILEAWDSMPFVDNVPVISHPYSHNYFHWTFEAVTKNRFFDGLGKNQVLVLEKDLQRLFQRDLLARTLGGKTALVQKDRAIRIRDPLLSIDIMTEESIHWVREAANITTESGDRRIYLRRTPGGTRSTAGGCINETPEFLAFIREFGFEIVDFGEREMRINEQAQALSGAAVILAPHGAALTNLAYLGAPLSLIEIVGPIARRAFFMHVASVLGFQYYGLFASLDENLNLTLDMEELYGAMDECLANHCAVC